jgi:pimeloyl-ACP methyl ester carboxylesterase
MLGGAFLMSLLRSSFLACCLTATIAAQPELPPAPGKLFDVDNGRRLHLLCTGQGSPTVVLEAGASAFAIDWTIVQNELQKSHRVCSYDRAGMGWSDSLPADAIPAERDTHDLHALLTAAKESAPFVLVGASHGGLLIRRYLAQYPGEVTGLVFVDPATEDRLFSMVRGKAFLIAEMTPDQIREGGPPSTVRVPRRPVQQGAPFDKLPPELYQQRLAADERLVAAQPSTLTPEAIFRLRDAERIVLADLLASRKAGAPFGDRPTVVLSRGDERNKEREDVHKALANLSTNSRHTVVVGSGHEIHLFQPRAVVTAVNDVMEAIARKGQLRPE